MALPQFYSFVVVHNSGQLLTFNSNGRILLKVWGLIVDPTTGKTTYTELAASPDDLGFEAGSSLADGAEIVGDIENDNTSTLFNQLQVQLEITHDEGAAIVAGNGGFTVFISTGDATGELETDASGYGSAEAAGLDPVGNLTCDPNVADDEVMRSRTFEW